MNKSVAEFYKDRTRASGLQNICKECCRIKLRLQRQNHREVFIRKDSKYYRKNKGKILASRKVWYEKNRHKVLAHEKVKNSVYKGLLTRQPCEMCGSIKSQAHHDDYDKPLDVRWLCSTHHMRFHAENQ